VPERTLAAAPEPTAPRRDWDRNRRLESLHAVRRRATSAVAGPRRRSSTLA